VRQNGVAAGLDGVEISEGESVSMCRRKHFFSTGTDALAEMGDTTQVATVILAAQYQAYDAVIAGTTRGMILANAPVVWLGERMTRLLPMRAVQGCWC
jgi:putative Ca2+/H+ antiporter (TMEM165/GDT1 family)